MQKTDSRTPHPGTAPRLRISPQNVIVSGILGSVFIACAVFTVCVTRPPWYLGTPPLLFAIVIPALLSLHLGRRFSRYIGELEAHARILEKQNQTAQRRQKKMQFFESVVQDSSDIIFTIDRDFLVFKFNKGAEEHFGWSQTEVLGRPLSGFFTDTARITAITAMVKAQGSAFNEEVEIVTRDGSRRRISLSISAMNYETEAVSGYVVTAKDITILKRLEGELLAKNDQLNRLAITDSLTGLFNVRHFYDQVKRELKRNIRTPDHPLSLVYIDVDHFKELNDTEGHQMGDTMLHGLGEIIGVCIRTDVDAGFRYGGDEFVILLPDTPRDSAEVVARRIAKQFGAFKFGRTSLSIGITEARAEDTPESIVKRADEAMYASKHGGRGRITLG